MTFVPGAWRRVCHGHWPASVCGAQIVGGPTRGRPGPQRPAGRLDSSEAPRKEKQFAYFSLLLFFFLPNFPPRKDRSLRAGSFPGAAGWTRAARGHTQVLRGARGRVGGLMGAPGPGKVTACGSLAALLCRCPAVNPNIMIFLFFFPSTFKDKPWWHVRHSGLSVCCLSCARFPDREGVAGVRERDAGLAAALHDFPPDATRGALVAAPKPGSLSVRGRGA